MNNLLTDIPNWKKSPCWKRIDDCLFFLLAKNVISHNEKAKFDSRVKKALHKQGLVIR